MKKVLYTVIALLLTQVALSQPPAGDANIGDVYGESFRKGKAIKGEQLESKLESGPLSGNIKGKVLEVCPKKGCWIKLELADKSVATVKMKDYGFFVPVKLEGKNIEINGNVEFKTTPVEELKHYAEDAKKPKEEIDAITEAKKEVRILANSIRVIK